MKTYYFKQAAELMGLSYKQFYYMISNNLFGCRVFVYGDKKLRINGLTEIARDYFQYKIDKASTPEKKAYYKAQRVILEMRLFAEDMIENSESTEMLFLARKLLANANKTTAFIEAHK